MRELKFRAWDKGKMSGTVALRSSGAQKWLKHLSPEAVIMQFTGLRDKNGREIYEGDIVRLYDDSGRKRSDHTVIFQKYMFTLDGFYCSIFDVPNDAFSEWPESRIEVIGNVWENPDLIIA